MRAEENVFEAGLLLQGTTTPAEDWVMLPRVAAMAVGE
jgi:hypothetical protein